MELLLGVFVEVVDIFLAIFLTRKLVMAEKTMEGNTGTLKRPRQRQIVVCLSLS